MSTLGREDWIRAATAALRDGGIDAVRVEALARELGVTKGSFYWHFADRAALLEALLAYWEEETLSLIAEARRAETPRARLLRFFERVAAVREYPPDTEILAWARRDPEVARRTVATEARRLRFIREQLEERGIPPREAARRAKAAYLATQGWIERIGRGAESYDSLPRFARYLFDLVSDASPGAERRREADGAGGRVGSRTSSRKESRA